MTEDKTSPEHWFIGYDAADPTEFDGNLVTPLVDGEEMMREIDNYIQLLGENDFAYFAGWEMSPALNLLDETSIIVDEADARRLDRKFVDAIEGGADIRILLYPGLPNINIVQAAVYPEEYNKERYKLHKSIVSLINDEMATLPDGNGEVILDQKRPWNGSHHQKCAIFGLHDSATGSYTLVAFCGGIDLAYGRWDSPGHTAYPHAKDGGRNGWHDVQVRIEGPAAAELLQNFVNRWNDQNHTVATELKTASTAIDLGSKSIVLPYTGEPDRIAAGYTQRVEVLYTYACPIGEEPFYNFAPDGMQTIEEAYIHAIRQAQHYIYIESPTFWSESIAEALYQQLEDTSVELIIVIPYSPDPAIPIMSYHEDKNINLLAQSKNYSTNCHVYDLRLPGAGYALTEEERPEGLTDSGYLKPVYVHSKLMIIDDIYAMVGSANLCARSMATDSELNVAVLDEATETDSGLDITVCKFARELRIKLWMEHLGVVRSEVENIQTALATWKSNVNDPNTPLSGSLSLVHPHDTRKISYIPDVDDVSAGLWNSIFDPAWCPSSATGGH